MEKLKIGFHFLAVSVAGGSGLTTAKGAAAVVGGVVVSLLGGGDSLLETMVVFVILDYLVGVIKAFIQKNVSSAIGAKGILKKMLYFFVVALANILETRVFGDLAPLRDVTIMFYVCNEGISIIENLIDAGVPLPEKLKDVLIQLKGRKGK